MQPVGGNSGKVGGGLESDRGQSRAGTRMCLRAVSTFADSGDSGQRETGIGYDS